MTSESNDEIRTQGKRNRRDLDDDVRTKLSAIICNRFLRSRHFFTSTTLACYMATRDEVDTRAVFQRAWSAKKRIFAPVVDAGHKMRFVEICAESRLEQNRYGIWEPVSGVEISAAALDAVVTPVVAFDKNLHRIGMGGGYYDRFFSACGGTSRLRRPKLIGFAFDCQKFEKITPNPWDMRLCQVFCESS